MRQQSEAADRLIQSYEAEGGIPRLEAYPDPGGIWTIGWGHTRGVRAGMKITKARARALYADDVHDAIETIYANLPARTIESWPQPCFDAMVSFVFNLGPKAFRSPQTGKRTDFWRAAMNTADLTAVPKQMQRWVKQGNVVLPGLVKRRGAEASMWGHGIELAKLALPLADGPFEGGESAGIEQVAQSAFAQQARVEPDEPAPAKLIEEPGVATAAVAGGAGVATVATTLTSAGTSMTASGSNVAMILGAVFILTGVIVLLLIARRR